MNMRERYSAYSGRIRVARVELATGRWQPILRKSNVIVYQAADLMARMMAGQPEYRPNYVGFIYGPNLATMPDPAATRAHDMTTIETDIQAVVGNMIVSPLNSNAGVSVDGDPARYAGNRATLGAISDSSSSLVFTGPLYDPNPPAGTDNYFQVALLNRILAPGSPTPTYRLFARSALSGIVGLPVQPGYELSIVWDVSFF